MKLYLKKLLVLLGTFLMWLSITVAVCVVLGLSKEPTVDYTKYSVCVAICGVITAVLTGVVKFGDNTAKLNYVTETQLQRRSFWQELLSILKSKPFIAEVIAFATWLVPLLVYVCLFPENATLPLYKKILTSLFVITEFTLIFALVDLIVTFTVRKIWMKKH
ncbi:MAG: hypothetical protein J6S13_07770 [Clostridia bacterium]|nr:hypothetical protein [Clostridia bacterium]